MDVHDDFAAQPPKANTFVVLMLIGLAALTISYLVAYAVPDALVAGQVIGPWGHAADPRPQWFVATSAGLFVAMLVVACVARFLSSRHLSRIDRMGEE